MNNNQDKSSAERIKDIIEGVPFFIRFILIMKIILFILNYIKFINKLHFILFIKFTYIYNISLSILEINNNIIYNNKFNKHVNWIFNMD